MGRAGGGGRVGGGRSGGGSFSRSGGGRSFSSGGRSSFGGSSFGGGRPGGSFGGPVHHRPPHHRPHHHVNLGPLVWGSGLGRRTVIINNSGNTTNTTGSQQNTQNTSEERTMAYTAPKPLTPEQKINRAERLAEEAANEKSNAFKGIVVGVVLFLMGLYISFVAGRTEYEKPSFAGTEYAGYAYDDGFTYNAGKTEAACEYFYEKTGIPLYFYTVGTYDKDASTCDTYTMELYDTLFEDENHVLVAYYDNVDWWSWAIGEDAKFYMGEAEVNELIDKIYLSWDNYNLSNDAVLAEGIVAYADELTRTKGGAPVLVGLLCIGGGFCALYGIVTYVNKGKDEKKYKEEAQTLRTEQMLSKPLETFGNQEVDDLKEKYDNM